MFQYIKRNILRRGVSPNKDFCFLAGQLVYDVDTSRSSLAQPLVACNSCKHSYVKCRDPLLLLQSGHSPAEAVQHMMLRRFNCNV